LTFHSTVEVSEPMNSDYILSAISTAGIRAKMLSPAETQNVLVRLRERLGVDIAAHAPWDLEDASPGRSRPDGWKLLPNYVGAASCLMFLNGARQIWEFASGRDLFRVLNECPALEFFVCDPAATYLLCHNHHDFVVGWGAAHQWVQGLGDE
jgi:hypothetical protein